MDEHAPSGLTFDAIYTTNFDHLIETVCREALDNRRISEALTSTADYIDALYAEVERSLRLLGRPKDAIGSALQILKFHGQCDSSSDGRGLWWSLGFPVRCRHAFESEDSSETIPDIPRVAVTHGTQRIVPATKGAILENLHRLLVAIKFLERRKARIIRLLIKRSAIRNFLQSIVQIEYRFFEYHGTGRPPCKGQVLVMDLVH